MATNLSRFRCPVGIFFPVMRVMAVPRILCFLASIFFLLAAVSTVGQEIPGEGRRIYVSPSGNDAWSGALASANADATDGPVASLSRAQELVREAKAATPATPITVLVRAGTYRLSRSLEFTPADSGTESGPVTFAAYPGEAPVISGGRPIHGWQRDGELWQARVPRTPDGGVWRFEALFVNGERRTRARTPNRGSFFRTDGPAGRQRNRSFYFREGDMQEWDRLRDVIVVLYHSWETSIHHIRAIDLDSRSVLLREPSRWPFGRWERQQRYYVENAFEALDEPGEWYLDRHAGLLYYYPLADETPDSISAIAPVVTSTLVSIQGDPANDAYVEHLHFRGLSFQHTDPNLRRIRNPGQGEIYQPGLIQAHGLRQSSIIDCEVAHTGAHGVWLGAGCSDVLVQRCHLHDLGGGGVYIGGGSGINDEFPTGNDTVDNSFIHDGSYVFRGAHGVWIGKSSHNTITHNEISNFDYSGVSCGWSWGFQPSSANHNAIEFNHIHHLGNGDGLSDMGGIYTLGVSPGTTLRHNHMHDIYSYAHVSHGSGVYPDEGSTGLLIENNVVYRVRTSPLFMHYGKECLVRNNIFAFGGAGQLSRSREDKRCHYIAVGNIVYGGENCDMLRGRWNNHDWEVGRNVYWCSGGNPVFAGMDFAEWQVHGEDEGSIVADPLFVDAANGDFRLRPESPALALGFNPVDVTQSGLYGDPDWVDLPKRYPNRERNDVPPPVQTPLRINFDFEAEEVAGEPLDGSVTAGSHGAALRIAADPTTDSQVLAFKDAPGQRHTWTPHINYARIYDSGQVALSWDMRNSAEEPAEFFVELRQYRPNSRYLVGPDVRVSADGAITASGEDLAVIPPGEWVHVHIDLDLDAEPPLTYILRLTTAAGEIVNRALPCRDEDFQRIEWLGIASTSDRNALFYIDNLKLGTAEERELPPRRRAVPAFDAKLTAPPAKPANDQKLMGHWTFDQDDGYTVTDHSGYGNDGEVWARLATGDFGTALYCDPAHPNVTVEDDYTLRFGTESFSIDLWICPTQLDIHKQDARRRFLGKNDHPRSWWVLDITPEGVVRLEMTDANRSGTTVSTKAGLPENAWSHLAIVVDRGSRKAHFYIDGEQDSDHKLPETFTGPLDVPAELSIGSTWQPFVGLLDNVRIFKRILIADEIETTYQQEKENRQQAEFDIFQ